MPPSGSGGFHFPKGYEPYAQGSDDEYYLGLGKSTVLAAHWDMLGDAVLNCVGTTNLTASRCEPTWAQVERAIPVMRNSGGPRGSAWQCSAYSAGGGVRTFVGSRGAGVESTPEF